jgi:uncharacterized protein YkwD
MPKARLLTLCIWTALLVLAWGTSGLLYAQDSEALRENRERPPRNGATGSADPIIRYSENGALNPESPLADVEALEQRCLSEINRVRRAHRLAPLEHSKELLLVARSHSRRMSDEGFFSHTDPDGFSIKERVNRAGIKWKAVAENIASSRGYSNPVAVSMHGWMDSAGHRSNILNHDFNVTAVGVWISATGAVYFTEIFVKR